MLLNSEGGKTHDPDGKPTDDRKSLPKIERTFGFLVGDAFHGVGIDHGGFQIAVPSNPWIVRMKDPGM